MIGDRIWTPAFGRSLIPQSCANTRTKTRYLKSNDQNKIYRLERTFIYMILIDFLQMYAIESIKTTSMENVHTGVLDKNKEPYLRSKDKAKKIKWCIKINTIKYVEMQKKWRFTIHYVKPTAQLLFKSRFPKRGHTYRRQVVKPRHQTPQRQSITKPETPLQNIQIA